MVVLLAVLVIFRKLSFRSQGLNIQQLAYIQSSYHNIEGRVWIVVVEDQKESEVVDKDSYRDSEGFDSDK